MPLLLRAGTDEEYHMMTRGKLMDRVRVALAGSIAVRVVLGEDTNFGMAGEPLDVGGAIRLKGCLWRYHS